MEIPRSMQVKVKPDARETHLELGTDGIWLAHVKAQPVDGKANAALIDLVAEHFHVRKDQVRIKSGASGRLKRLLIST